MAEGKNDTVTVSYKLPFSPIMDDALFFTLQTWKIFFTLRSDSFEAWEGLYQKKDSLQN